MKYSKSLHLVLILVLVERVSAKHHRHHGDSGSGSDESGSSERYKGKLGLVHSLLGTIDSQRDHHKHKHYNEPAIYPGGYPYAYGYPAIQNPYGANGLAGYSPPPPGNYGYQPPPINYGYPPPPPAMAPGSYPQYSVYPAYSAYMPGMYPSPTPPPQPQQPQGHTSPDEGPKERRNDAGPGYSIIDHTLNKKSEYNEAGHHAGPFVGPPGLNG